MLRWLSRFVCYTELNVICLGWLRLERVHENDVMVMVAVTVMETMRHLIIQDPRSTCRRETYSQQNAVGVWYAAMNVVGVLVVRRKRDGWLYRKAATV